MLPVLKERRNEKKEGGDPTPVNVGASLIKIQPKF